MDEIKEINFNETGDIIDTLSGISLKDTPEERVRQRFFGILQTEYSFPYAIIAREVPVQQGSKFYYRLMKLKFVQILLFTRIKKHV